MRNFIVLSILVMSISGSAYAVDIFGVNIRGASYNGSPLYVSSHPAGLHPACSLNTTIGTSGKFSFAIGSAFTRAQAANAVQSSTAYCNLHWTKLTALLQDYVDKNPLGCVEAEQHSAVFNGGAPVEGSFNRFKKLKLCPKICGIIAP